MTCMCSCKQGWPHQSSPHSPGEKMSMWTNHSKTPKTAYHNWTYYIPLFCESKCVWSNKRSGFHIDQSTTYSYCVDWLNEQERPDSVGADRVQERTTYLRSRHTIGGFLVFKMSSQQELVVLHNSHSIFMILIFCISSQLPRRLLLAY